MEVKVKIVVAQSSLETIRSKIWSIDLGPIRFKLMDPNEGEGWSLEKTEEVQEQYRQFLYLTVTRNEAIVPTKDIDTFWHAHILDTVKYFADCETAFGFYLHHFPYFGMRSDKDAQNLASAFIETNKIWEEVFGNPLLLEHACMKTPGATTCGICGGSCTACSAGNLKFAAGIMQTSWRPSA